MSSKKITDNHTKLSIQLSSDGFSFCVYNYSENNYKHIESISFDYKTNTPDELLGKVKNIFENNTLLHQTYNEIVLIHHNDMNTFVPIDYFDEDILHTYLQNTIKVFENDYVNYDELVRLQVNNVYIPFVNVNNYIFDSFGEFTFLHSSTVFIENVIKTNTIVDKELFINVYKNDFQLLVLENNQLILSNHFSYYTKEDFVYYVLFVAEQLNMNTNEFSLTLYGEITEQNECYKLLYNYIRNIKIYNTLNTKLDVGINVLPQSHFNLLQQHT